MDTDYGPLKFISSRPINYPFQLVSKHSLSINVATNLAIKTFERKLGINHEQLRIFETIYESPYPTKYAANKKLRIRHYIAQKPKSDESSTVIVLPQRGYGFDISPVAAAYLCQSGIDTYHVQPPLRGERLPNGNRSLTDIVESFDDVKSVFKQAVYEIQHLAGIVPHDKIGVLGVSLGAMYASIACGTYPIISCAALLLPGANIVESIYESNDRLARKLRKIALKENMGKFQITEEMKDIEPLNFVDTNKSEKILVVLGKKDKAALSEYSMQLARAWNTSNVITLRRGHISIALDAEMVLKEVTKHFHRCYE